ncbi:MAG: CNNM domain-containing protein [Thermodesulfobacteriota bacterium]|nr:CNNM domain-containing protein [Thermodesulfobacteriota bacterium]
MTEDQWYQLSTMGLLFLLSAFFSGSETALLAMDRLRVKFLVEKKRPGANELERLLDNPERLLGGILVGNNLVNIALSVLATTFFIDIFGSRGDLMTIAILTPMLLIIAEVCPKTYAARRAEVVSFQVLRPIKLVLRILSPVIWLVIGISGLITRLFKNNDSSTVLSADEIKSMISLGARTGSVGGDQHRMLHGVFELSQLRVRDLMIPRPEVNGVNIDLSFTALLDQVKHSTHSRFPVYQETLDNVVGVIHSKDVLRFVDNHDDFDIYTVMRSPYFVPEGKQVESLLRGFRKRRIHLAVVIDEYGGSEGIVTLEDVLEEIVGEIQDEYDDEEEQGVIPLGHGSFIIDGGVTLRMLNRRFDVDFPEEDATTLAGLMLCYLGHIPASGEQCQLDGVVLLARKVVQQRIDQIELRLPPR